ncbi:hypothetical protein F4Z99_04080 [Candidatus Poribacteria bacterium]|nr:hypothetical protein [Candidatus Poribacteria bacterium]
MKNEIQTGDNVVYSNVYGSWSCKVVEVIDEITYKLRDVFGQTHIALHQPNNSRKDTVTKFEKGSLFMALR